MAHLVAPSILNADFLRLGEVVEMLNESKADQVHLDIMDGVFVPNLTFGFPVIKQIKSVSKKPLDVHLMITGADRHIEQFRDAGADMLTVHYEAVPDLEKTLRHIASLGMKPSVSVKPATDVSVLTPYLDLLHMVLIMTVEPGFGGQSFIESSYEKVSSLRNIIDKKGASTLIQVDGGVSIDNLPKLRDHGVDVFVVGTSIFRAENPKAMIDALKKA